ncbi:MAG: hypothetical protein M5U26_13200 [Planctomycetota bacterium]|nr:hypothetical protein [Planctomycetota bacterium]
MADEFCKVMVCKTPVEIALKISSWQDEKATLIQLADEDRRFEFLNQDLPIRVCFARHAQFMRDKARCPEFFCWPSLHFVQHAGWSVDFKQSMALWNEHQPLFFADIQGEIFPLLLAGREEKNISDTFNNFYLWNTLYDFARQWTVCEGPFNYNYTWMAPRLVEDETKPHIDRMFRNAFGIDPDLFSVDKSNG